MAVVEYEKEPCGRCGGSGRYSFNMIDRDRCYGCSGTGLRLTKRGRAAKAFADSMLNIPICDLAGRSAIYIDTLGGRRLRFTGAVEENGYFRPLFSGVPGNYSLSRTMPVRLVPSEADVAAIMNYQASLTKAGKPKKEKA
jgi:hypothetical protein